MTVKKGKKRKEEAAIVVVVVPERQLPNSRIERDVILKQGIFPNYSYPLFKLVRKRSVSSALENDKTPRLTRRMEKTAYLKQIEQFTMIPL